MAGRKAFVVLAVVLALALAAVAGYMTRDKWLHYVTGGGKVGGFTVVTRDGVRYKECYVCPMHPQIVKPAPGDCPICGMALVKKELPLDDAKPAAPGQAGGMEGMAGMETTAGLERITLDPRQRMLANVGTTEAVVKDLSRDVHAVGRVAVDEDTIRVATAWFPGRVERSYVGYAGQQVKKGARIMSIYSPELVSAQKEYLVAKNAAARISGSGFPEIASGSRDIAESARARLMQWGLTKPQVDRLDETGEVTRVLDIYSPVSGTVSMITAREGGYVGEGSELFRVADLGTVWVNAELYEFEFSKAGVGAHADVTADAFPGEVFHGKVSFIDPVVDSESRTVKARVVLPNKGGRLRPEMFVNVDIHSMPRRAVTIPASAVLYTGRRDVVWVEVEPGVFEPRDVSLGIRSADEFEVLSGIKAGEVVVSQGGFIIDSEAELRKSSGQSMPGMDMGGGK